MVSALAPPPWLAFADRLDGLVSDARLAASRASREERAEVADCLRMMAAKLTEAADKVQPKSR